MFFDLQDSAIRKAPLPDFGDQHAIKIQCNSREIISQSYLFLFFLLVLLVLHHKFGG